MKTEVLVVLDSSGSMRVKKNDVIGGFNGFIKTLQEDTRLTLVTFNSSEYKKVYDAVEVKYVKPLDDKTFLPDGWTPLYDSLCKAIDDIGQKFAQMQEKNRPDVVVCVIMTDGEENDSKTFKLKDAKKRIAHQQDKYNWTFIYLGANQDSFKIGGSLSIASIYTANYEDSKFGYRAAFASSANTINSLMKGETPKDLSTTYSTTLENLKK